jgi:hypothetical protein
MSIIIDNHTVTNEIIISERVATTEFRVMDIHESIVNRSVRADLELGPFTTETMPNGETVTRGRSRHSLTVWQDVEYDVVRDTWTNETLVTKVTEILNG